MHWRTVLAGAFAPAVLAVGACDGAPAPGRPAPLVLERVIPLQGDGRIDHLAIDARGRRLFVAELGAGALEAVDLESGRSLARLTGLKAPQGVGYLPALDEVVVASAGDGSVRFLKAADLSPVAAVQLGDDADDVRVSRSGAVFVGYGAGGLARIDAASAKVAATAPLGAHPEGFSLDEGLGRAFANVPDHREVAVVDLGSAKVIGAWRMGLRLANFPMALDPASHRVAVAFRLPGRLALFDEANGTRVADAAVCADADDVYFDARRRRLYVSCGEGRVDTFKVDGDRLEPLAVATSRPGARTSLYSPELDRLYVAARRQGAQTAGLLVYRPAP